MSSDFRDNEERHRFELDVEGSTAFVSYRKTPDTITLVHTVVPPELGGKGVAVRCDHAVDQQQ